MCTWKWKANILIHYSEQQIFLQQHGVLVGCWLFFKTEQKCSWFTKYLLNFLLLISATWHNYSCFFCWNSGSKQFNLFLNNEMQRAHSRPHVSPKLGKKTDVSFLLLYEVSEKVWNTFLDSYSAFYTRNLGWDFQRILRVWWNSNRSQWKSLHQLQWVLDLGMWELGNQFLLNSSKTWTSNACRLQGFICPGTWGWLKSTNEVMISQQPRQWMPSDSGQESLSDLF